MNGLGYLKRYLGVLLLDYARFSFALSSSGKSYLAIHNRNESLESFPGKLGYRCLWRWGTDLHAPKFISSLGLRLMKRALRDHPIVRSHAPDAAGGKPDVTYIIGHRGIARIPHLLATLESIAGQAGVTVECIVLEQDAEPKLLGRLPAWVKHVHTPPPTIDMPYCRSWAFNIGVKHAHSTVLVLHDNDMLVPADYSVNILEKVLDGYEVVNLKRFIFYLTEKHTNHIFSSNEELLRNAPDYITQNLEAGGSVAITKNAYEAIGGLDESFVGWGGEDNEFWERAQTRKVWNYAYLPVVHLWHAAQPGKAQPDNETRNRYKALSAVSAEARIATLKKLENGQKGGPLGWIRQHD